ncbi:MAG: hypothetical protein ACTS27_05740, partial [Phycisphaerales bacterium]
NLMRMNVKAWSVLSCAVAALSSSALAVPLAPGDQVNLSGTTSAESPWLGGVSLLADVFPFTITDSQGSPVFQGTFTCEPIRSAELGTLYIRYRLRDMQAIGNRAVARVDILGYGETQTNVDYSLTGLGDVGPSAAARSASGQQVTFFFDPLLFVSQDSRLFWAFTNATERTNTGQARITLNTGESVVIQGVCVPSLGTCPGDSNGDGVVNFADLNEVLSEFGEDCP